MKLSEIEILEGFNEVFDGLIPLYWYGLFLYIIVWLWTILTKEDEEEKPVKQYNYQKRSELAKWKRLFEGKWDNVSRNGFYELMLFNGAPKKIAEKYKNMPYGQRIEMDAKDENEVKIGTTGFPTHDGVWVNAASSEDLATVIETTAPSKKAMTMKTWWDIDQQQLLTSLYYPDTYLTALQRRSITSEGNLKLEVELRKFARTCRFEAEFQKVAEK